MTVYLPVLFAPLRHIEHNLAEVEGCPCCLPAPVTIHTVDIPATSCSAAATALSGSAVLSMADSCARVPEPIVANRPSAVDRRVVSRLRPPLDGPTSHSDGR